MNTLIGDTNWNKTVSTSDIAQTKAQCGMPLTAANFRTDVNVNGAINDTDVSIVKIDVGSGVP